MREKMLEAIDITIHAFLGRIPQERFERLRQSTTATLGELARGYGRPSSQDIAYGNEAVDDWERRLKLMGGSPLSPSERLILVQLYGMRSVILNKNNSVSLAS